MIYSRHNYVDRVEIKSFGRNTEEDATLMLIALRDIKMSKKHHCDAQYEIDWHVTDRYGSVKDNNGEPVEWCKLQYADDRWIYCRNNVCMMFSRDELKTSILYIRDDNGFVSIDDLLNTIISILVCVGIPEQYLFTPKQREFLKNCGARRAMEERLIDLDARINMLENRISQDSQAERNDESNYSLNLMRRNLENALFDKDNAERFLAAISV